MNARRKFARDPSWVDEEIAMDYPSGVFDGAGVSFTPIMGTEAEETTLYDADIDQPLFFYEKDVSSESLEYEDLRVMLQSIIEQMVEDAPTWDGEPIAITNEAAETAIRFLKALPSNRELPKVAPDGEGDVLFVWEPPHGDCIVTVEGNVLHMVDRPSTNNAEHVDGKRFAGYRIPVSILHAIPMK